MSNPSFLENIKIYFQILSAETFTKHAINQLHLAAGQSQQVIKFP